MKPTFFIQSLGCKVSQYDAERLCENLTKIGFVQVSINERPDLFVLNSCSVTGRASQKCRQAMNSSKRRWPETRVLLAGCEAKLRDLESPPRNETSGLAFSEGIPANVPLVSPIMESAPMKDSSHRRDTILNDADAVLLPDYTEEHLRKIVSELGFSDPEPLNEGGEVPMGMKKNRTRAFLKIQDGCNQFCTYCIVPHLRGAETSKPLAEIFREAEILASQGFREIVVTGIHLGRYHSGLVPLLEKMSEIAGIDRIRLSSIEPLEVDDGLIACLSSIPKICPHLHLPLQAGHDQVLKAMNRPYDTAGFARIVERIRSRLPDLGLTTDVMVGFPGETEAQFAAGLTFIEKMGFSRMHIFRFSPRNRTPAATFPNQIPGPVKKERAERLESLRKSLSGQFHARFLHREVEILWEDCEHGIWSGFSREYLPCRMRCGKDVSDRANSLEKAKIVTVDSEHAEVLPI